jgi:hypothetical protein
MQGILIFRSGVPYTVTMSRDVANTGVGGQRHDRIASGKSSDPRLARWFDPTAFVAASNFTYGNAGIRVLSPDNSPDHRLFPVQAISDHRAIQAHFASRCSIYRTRRASRRLTQLSTQLP